VSGDTTLAMAFDDIWMPLPIGETVTASVVVDPITSAIVEPFDYAWTGTTTFIRSAVPPELPPDWGIGVIVGASGSGKSTLLGSFGTPAQPDWDGSRAIGSHFADADDAADRFAAVGLNSVPTWTKPYPVLSTGEKFRADLSRMIRTGAVVDEFTSVVDRNVAVSASNALRRWVDANGVRRVVLATCHRDVLPWLQPDWVIDLDIKSWSLRPRECLQRENPVVAVYPSTTTAWDVFAPHHYLSEKLNGAAMCYLATINDAMFGFTAVLPFPNGNLRDAFREHRTVVLPDFQGLGLGVRLSDFVAAHYVNSGRRYFSRTAHPRMGRYRDASPLWRTTGSSQKQARHLTDYMSADYVARRQRTGWDAWDFDAERIAWSHEYVGTEPVVHAKRERELPMVLGL
jgi:GNAT superfamily N-acetyltransferase